MQGMQMEDVCPCKHDNNLPKKFIFINNLYKFPLVLWHVFFLLPLFTDIFNAASLFNLGLVLTDVFEVLCLCSIERVQEISGNSFFPSYKNSHE